MKKNLGILALCLVMAACGTVRQKSPNYISVNSPQELFAWFRYVPGRDIVISGHRGGMMPGYPENCIESFEKTLTYMPSFFEVDPRLTKDGVIVLMHDATIDRTTNGTGRVSDYTYEELQQFNLVDRDGNLTPYKIPALKDVIEWSRGKTILNFDIKDVPLDVLSDFIANLKPAPQNLMYTVHNPQHVRMYLDRNPDAMFSAHCQTMEKFLAYDTSGMPWEQVMAYVGRTMAPENAQLYDSLRSRGVMCMISVAPTHDNLAADEAKTEGYLKEIAARPDVIETDYPYLFKSLDLSKRNF